MKSNSFKIKNTLGMFDLFKGFCMIMIFLGHTYGIDQLEVSPLVVITGMTLFVVSEASIPGLFVVSGYGFRKTTFSKCVKKQFSTLFIPYIVTMIITSIVHFISLYLMYGGLKNSVVETMRYFLAGTLGLSPEQAYFGFQLKRCGPIWYVLALMIGIIILNQLANYLDEKKLLIASAVIACAGWLISLVVTVPWCFSQGMVATFYVCLGHLAKKNKFFTSDHDKKKMISATVALAVLILVLGWFRGRSDIASNIYQYGILSIVMNGVASVLLIYWFLHLNRFEGAFSTTLRKVGRLSLYVFCIHSIEYVGFGQYLQYDFFNNWQGSKGICILIVFALRTLLVVTAAFGFVQIKDRLTKINAK